MLQVFEALKAPGGVYIGTVPIDNMPTFSFQTMVKRLSQAILPSTESS